jgi:membrane associated rhomboid family serine protease
VPDRSVVRREVDALVLETQARIRLVLGWTGLLWGIEVLDLLLGHRLDAFGVHPRSLGGLVGIAFAPFLHAGFGHLLANTVPLLVLGFLVCARKRMDFTVVAATGAVWAGLGAWLFGAPGSVHIGASGVIFAFFGFLLGRGWWERRPGTMLLSLLVGTTFGGMLWGVLPTVAEGISWQSHLFGFLGGLMAARSLGQGLRRRRR